MKAYWIALALCVPAAAQAQSRVTATAPTTLQVVATGAIDAPASSITASVTFSVSGADQAAAEKAKQAKYAAILQALQSEGIPSSALMPLAQDDPARIVMTNATPAIDDALADDGKKDDATTADPVTLGDGYTLKVATLSHLKAVSDALAPLGVTTGAPVSAIDDMPGVQRQAKAKALATARGDADVYARELGLRVVRVARIDEAGQGLLLPGLQDMILQMAGSGPQAMRKLFESKPGTVRVSQTILVEFVLAP